LPRPDGGGGTAPVTLPAADYAALYAAVEAARRTAANIATNAYLERTSTFRSVLSVVRNWVTSSEGYMRLEQWMDTGMVIVDGVPRPFAVAPADVMVDDSGATLLHAFAKTSNSAAATPAVALLVGKGRISVEARDAGGRTPLHIAAMFGNYAMAAALVAAGANPDTPDAAGYTPSFLASTCIVKTAEWIPTTAIPLPFLTIPLAGRPGEPVTLLNKFKELFANARASVARARTAAPSLLLSPPPPPAAPSAVESVTADMASLLLSPPPASARRAMLLSPPRPAAVIMSPLPRSVGTCDSGGGGGGGALTTCIYFAVMTIDARPPTASLLEDSGLAFRSPDELPHAASAPSTPGTPRRLDADFVAAGATAVAAGPFASPALPQPHDGDLRRVPPRFQAMAVQVPTAQGGAPTAYKAVQRAIDPTSGMMAAAVVGPFGGPSARAMAAAFASLWRTAAEACRASGTCAAQCDRTPTADEVAAAAGGEEGGGRRGFKWPTAADAPRCRHRREAGGGAAVTTCFDLHDVAARTPATVCSACELRLLCPQRCGDALCEFSAVAVGNKMWSSLVGGGVQPTLESMLSDAHVPLSMLSPSQTRNLTATRASYTSSKSKQAFSTCWDFLKAPRWAETKFSDNAACIPNVYGEITSTAVGATAVEKY